MHDTQYRTMTDLMTRFFLKDSRKTVYDIGSLDINGSHRPIVENLILMRYIGVDITAGKNVDIVVKPYDWGNIRDASCEYMVSGSCLEHVQAPWLWAKEAEKKLKSGGILIVLVPFTIREHRYPVDCWRVLPDGLKFLFCDWAKLECLECQFNDENKDAYFVGRKP